CGPWNEKLSLCNDTEYFTRAVLASRKIAFCSDSIAYYRSGNQTLSGKRDKAALESFHFVCDLCVQHILSAENSERTRHACAGLWQFFVYWTYPDASDLVADAEERVRQFGGSNVKLRVSRPLEFLGKVIGWKTAKRVQRAYYAIRYS